MVQGAEKALLTKQSVGSLVTRPAALGPRSLRSLAPFAGANGNQVMALLLGGKRPSITPSSMDIYLAAAELAHLPHRPEDGVPLPIARIIESCLRQDPLEWPVFSQVMRHTVH